MSPKPGTTITVDLSQVYSAIAAVQANLDTESALLAELRARIVKLEEPAQIPAPPTIPTVPADSAEFAAAVIAWNRNMLTYGAQVAALLNDPNQPDAVKEDGTYYDLPWVFWQMSVLTGDAQWKTAAETAHTYYRKYIDSNAGRIQAIWLFPHGLHELGDDATVTLLAGNASFAGSYPLDWTVSADSSREVAYNVMTKLVAGGTVWGLEEQALQMFGHLAQWTTILNGQPVTTIPAGQSIPTYVRPFMAALTSYGLIEWAGTDAARLKQVTDTLAPFWALAWSKTFLAQQPVMNNPGLGLVDTMMYTDKVAADGTGGMDAVPDLNLLIAPVFAWLYSQTKDTAWREKHDTLFIGGVKGGYLGNGKQFNQQYQRSFMGLKWRAL